jgi:hypothetical protein
MASSSESDSDSDVEEEPDQETVVLFAGAPSHCHDRGALHAF